MQTPSLGLYVLASLALIATPGQDMMYVVSRALAQGRRAGVLSAIGVCLGILVHTALAALGVGAILQASEALFLALKLAGAAYLAWLGARMILKRGAAAALEPAGDARAAATLVWQGMVSNVTNAKIVLFFFAFLPQFVDPASAHATRDLIALGVLYAALALPVKGAVALLAGTFSDRVLRRPRAIAWMNRACGVAMLALAARLAADERR
ncbi:MAG TPA: LysE family translocator [Usitatibacter sp.]|nr:LysE family translocator [Usitatibacter sp.]